jgi:hypothetical protein
MASNYPAGVTDAHPYFNPPGEMDCVECGEETYPGATCPECGVEQPTEADLAYEAEEAAAEAKYDMMKEDGGYDAEPDDYDPYA